MIPVTIELPENLARRAAEAGLLDGPAIEAMIRDQLRRNSIRDLLRAADEVVRDPGPPMTLEEIQQEVDEVRKARRRRASGS